MAEARSLYGDRGAGTDYRERNRTMGMDINWTSRTEREINFMNPAAQRAGLGTMIRHLRGGVGQCGEIFYADPVSGNDKQNGKSRDTAKKTLQAAIDLCVANRGDVVIRMRGGEAVTSTVTFDCAGMTVMAEGYGMAPLAIGEYFATYSETLTAAPVATVTADGVTIAGLGFAGDDARSMYYDGAAMLVGGLATAAPFGVRIVNCRFPKWGLDNRIGLAVEGSTDCIIEDCSFEGVTQDFGSGIYVQGAAQNIEILNNRFRNCTYGILFGVFSGGGPHCIVKGNICEDSKLLSASSAATGIICGNWSEAAKGNTTYNGTIAAMATYGLVSCNNFYPEVD